MSPSAPPGRYGAFGLFGLYPYLAECLDDVANFEGIVVFEDDAALVALRHLAHIILAAPNGLDEPGEDRLAAALDAHLRRADDLAIGDAAAADNDLTPNLEELHHLGVAVHLLAIDWLQQTLEGRLDVLDELVDDVVRANIHALDAGEPLRRRVHLHVEGDDDGT